MYNTPGGGDLIIGIKETRNDSRIEYTGITKQERNSFEKGEEKINAIINGYSNTTIEPIFEIIEDLTFDTAKDFLIIKVPHYQEYPNITKKDGNYIGKRGNKLYKFKKNDLLTRSKGPKYSSCKAGQGELNEMVELGAKGVRSKCQNILNLESTEKRSIRANIFKDFSNRYQKERKDIYGDL